MKTVLLCIDTLANAGAQRFVTELACNLNLDKYTPIVLVTNNLDYESHLYKKIIGNHIEVIDASDKDYFREIKKIVNILKHTKPVIIHTNVGAALHMLLPCLLSGCKARHLFTVHSMGYRIFSGSRKILMKFCFKKGIVVPVAISDTVKESLISVYDLRNTQVECVYNGIDTDLFYPQKRCFETHNIVFISVGTLYHIKNHKLLVDAFAILHKRQANTVLKIVGDGELRLELIKRVNELGIQDAVVFEGNQNDVAPYLNSADVYCCTSKVEGLPIAVLEAMACGLPVISTPAGGVVDIVKNGKNGFIVEACAEKIAEKMELLIQNESLRQSLAKYSREMAVALDIHVCTQKYEGLYEKYSDNRKC